MTDLITLDTVPSIDRWVDRSIDQSFQSWQLTHDCRHHPVSWVQPFFICAEKWRSLQSLLPSCRLNAFLSGQPRALLNKAEPTLSFCLDIKVNNINNISNTILSKPSQTYSKSHTTSISSSSFEKRSKVDSSPRFQNISTAGSVLCLVWKWEIVITSRLLLAI